MKDCSNLQLQTDIEEMPLSELSTPMTHSGQTSPISNGVEVVGELPTAPAKKKKKKKSKKSSKSSAPQTPLTDDEGRLPVLCISRNKHWRYISSYHGPWLQLPLELLDSLLTLNLDPSMYGHDARHSPPPSFRYPPPEPPRLSLPPPLPGKATPPPIDPGVFRSVRNIRRLIDEAAELSVRASSGLSAAELSAMRSNAGPSGNPWATAQALGLNPPGSNGSGGRTVPMSATRVHRLRVLAVQKLAQAYREDEIASSVMVMQGGSVFEDVAERVLRQDPNDADARYVHFFHEKIPSRQLAESTTTHVLDDLIAAYPHHLEYYRTRGIVHCFREEFPDAVKDFTYALREARAVRKANTLHSHGNKPELRPTTKQGKRRKNTASSRRNGQAPADGTSVMDNLVEDSEPEPAPSKHPSLLDDAPEPIEPQLLFLRAAAHLQHAMYLIESAVLDLEDVSKHTYDGSELRLSYLDGGKYGGVEVCNPHGPLGSWDGAKLKAYAATLGKPSLREHVTQLLKKALRDHRSFLAQFDSLENTHLAPEGDIAAQTEHAFYLSEPMRPANPPQVHPTSHAHGHGYGHKYQNHHPHSASSPPRTPPDTHPPSASHTYTTYHPLLVESHFSVLICQMMLADFPNVLTSFVRAASVVDGLEGYPIFLPPRSMAQAEFVEVLERLSGGWANGVQPHSLSAQRGKSRMSERGVSISSSVSGFGSSGSVTLSVSASGSSGSTYGSGSVPVSRAPSSSSFSSCPPYEDLSMTASGSSSSSMHHDNIPSGSSSNSLHHRQPHPPINTSASPGSSGGVWKDPAEALDCARILLAPVAKRQRQRFADAAALEKAGTGSKKPQAAINIPLHGARVDIILAWMGAVHLCELDALTLP
ncbi:hypothetical protein D9619_002543 [Psilocybe cf. subviscida]|uniref:Uncharacterized protein n=1 Tax=Psilocybe cf. subviscida TaxID=2480587 RepID=A0A8H5AWD3_9AGAR|nr:hypothetical protein D9619_002543 [Psilocybe cf. subviscida]